MQRQVFWLDCVLGFFSSVWYGVMWCGVCSRLAITGSLDGVDTTPLAHSFIRLLEADPKLGKALPVAFLARFVAAFEDDADALQVVRVRYLLAFTSCVCVCVCVSTFYFYHFD